MNTHGPVIGVALGNRYTAVALVASGRLVRARVHEMPSGNDAEPKLRRLIAIVGKLLRLYRPRRIAVVAPAEQRVLDPLRERVRTWLGAIAPVWDLAYTFHGAHEIRRAWLPEGKQCNRRLSTTLSLRFPELRPAVPVAADGRPLRRFGVPSDTERRASRLHLAIGGALLDHELAPVS